MDLKKKIATKPRPKIDQIIDLIMEEARARSSADMVNNLYRIIRDIDDKIIISMERIKADERKKERENEIL